jgi:signal transduction histidine kinase
MTWHTNNWARTVLLATAYFVAARLGLWFAVGEGNASPVWPASGLAVGAMLLWGYRLWPGVVVGAFLASLIREGGQSGSLWPLVLASGGIAIGNTLEALAGTWLAGRFAKGPAAFDHPFTIFRFAGLSAAPAALLSPVLGLGSLAAAGLEAADKLRVLGLTWWLGDLIGLLFLTPLLVAWGSRPVFPLDRRWGAEMLGVGFALLLLAGVTWGGWLPDRTWSDASILLFVPILLWAALRLGCKGAAAALLLLACLSIPGTLHGRGPFAMPDRGTSLLLLQVFLAMAGLMAYVLAATVNQRLSAQEEILRLNAELEKRVRERTLQLEAINRELEAFSYSVSHDLRAPLRSIRGFSEVLLERYGPNLDAQGQDFLRRACASCHHMDRLIEDLLKLSRVGRAELQARRVDLSALAESILLDLRKTEPEREAEGVITPGLTAWGDERLLRLALDNLLRNAWKFTRKKPRALIEFGLQPGPEPAFYVRDNGAGFDMAYAAKLFGVFQRLHSSADFPGTGVGLATVQRIINRHGGRVWASAVMGEGATFYFTLPENGAS